MSGDRALSSGSSSGDWSLVDLHSDQVSNGSQSDIEIISNPSTADNYDVMDQEVIACNTGANSVDVCGEIEQVQDDGEVQLIEHESSDSSHCSGDDEFLHQEQSIDGEGMSGEEPGNLEKPSSDSGVVEWRGDAGTEGDLTDEEHGSDAMISDESMNSIIQESACCTESDIEFVSEPQLEFDDEEYLAEVLRSTQLSPVASATESEGSFSDSIEDEKDVEQTTEVRNPKQPGCHHDQYADDREIVLEVNLTLLSFTIIVGVSGMSGFLLGGIYSAVLTNTIPSTTDITQYPGAIPNFQYKEANTSCLSDMENKVRQLNESVSECRNHLRSAVQHNQALAKINTETASYASKQCSISRSKTDALKSKSSHLQSEVEFQKQKIQSVKKQSKTDKAYHDELVKVLRRDLRHVKSDLVQTRKSLSALESGGKSSIWKDLYFNTIADLKKAGEKIADLKDDLQDEREELSEKRAAHSNTKMQLSKEQKSRNYFQSLAKKNGELLNSMERKYLRAKAQKCILSDNFDTSNSHNDASSESYSNVTVTSEVEPTQPALRSKQSVESKLISKLSSNRQQISSLRERFGAQVRAISELEQDRSVLAKTLMKRVEGTTKSPATSDITGQNVVTEQSTELEVLQDRVTRSESERSKAMVELEQCRATMIEFQEKFDTFKNRTKELEEYIAKLHEEIAERETLQNERDTAVREQYNSEIAELHSDYEARLSAAQHEFSDKLSHTEQLLNESVRQLRSKTVAMGEAELRHNTSVRQWEMKHNSTISDLGRKHNESVRELEKKNDKLAKSLEREVEKRKSVVTQHKIRLDKASTDLGKCNSEKDAEFANHKRSNTTFIEVLRDVASEKKLLHHQNTSSTYDDKDLVYFNSSDLPNNQLSVSPMMAEEFCHFVKSCCQVLRSMKSSTGDRLSLLRDLYHNISSSSSFSSSSSPSSPDMMADWESCFRHISPLLPTGVSSRIIGEMINMTLSVPPAASRLGNALKKYWSEVQKTYFDMAKKSVNEDWYFKRFGKKEKHDSRNNDWYLEKFREKWAKKDQYSHSWANPRYIRNGDWYLDGKNRRETYSFVDKSKVKSKTGKGENWTSDIDCRYFNCLGPMSTGYVFDLDACGC